MAFVFVAFMCVPPSEVFADSVEQPEPSDRETTAEGDLEERIRTYLVENLIGDSPQMVAIRKDLAKDARKLVGDKKNVLLHGDTGTGKGHLAHILHRIMIMQEATGKAVPFEEFNFALVPKALRESELRGVAKGAFTGSDRTRRGVIERAHGGVVLLDEFDTVSRQTEIGGADQKLLNGVLEHGQIQALGKEQPGRFSVMFIAAMQSDPMGPIEQGGLDSGIRQRFDKSYYLPPLAERPGDVEALVNHFLKEHQHVRLVDETLGLLKGYSWPGNVRELKRVIDTVVETGANIIGPKQLFSALQFSSADENDVLKSEIADQMVRRHGSSKKAADALDTYAARIEQLRAIKTPPETDPTSAPSSSKLKSGPPAAGSPKEAGNERNVAHPETQVLSLEAARTLFRSSVPRSSPEKRKLIEELVANYVQNVVQQQANGDIGHAASLLGVQPRTVSKHLTIAEKSVAPKKAGQKKRAPQSGPQRGPARKRRATDAGRTESQLAADPDFLLHRLPEMLAGSSQTQVAKALGITQSAVSRLNRYRAVAQLVSERKRLPRAETLMSKHQISSNGATPPLSAFAGELNLLETSLVVRRIARDHGKNIGDTARALRTTGDQVRFFVRAAKLAYHFRGRSRKPEKSR